MKKNLLLAFAILFTTGLFSQSLSLIYESNPLAPGATIQVIGDPTAEYIQAKIDVKNNSATPLDVKVKKVILNPTDTLPGTKNYFCWGLCFLPTTYVSPNFITIAGSQTISDFYGDYNPNLVVGVSKVTYVFFDQNNVNDSVAVQVEYNASPASIGENQAAGFTLSGAYPNPAITATSVDYKLPVNTRKASIVVTNMLGARVKEIAVTDIAGNLQIPVSDLLNGVYFYSLVADDRFVMTRKFVVKK